MEGWINAPGRGFSIFKNASAREGRGLAQVSKKEEES